MTNNPPAEPKLFSAHHDVFDALCSLNRRRRMTYLLFTAFSIAFLFFATEYLPHEQFFGGSVPGSDINSTVLGNSERNHPTAVQLKPTLLPTETVEPVAFTLIMWSEDSALEGALLIKSILLYNTRPSDIHIICDDEAEKVLRLRLTLLQNPSRRIRVWFYKPSWQSILDRVEREGSIATDHSAGLHE